MYLGDTHYCNYGANWFIKFGTSLYQQITDIPVGSDSAPFMASLFLYYYEDKWIWKTKRKDLVATQKFGNVFHFIDDLTSINDGREFKKALHKIYPPELGLKKENTLPFEASFLDLNIKIWNKKFMLGLCDKSDFFLFSIV